jgi:ABC-2 type transport system permease protein
MRNIWLIARREYLERVRQRSFLIMTIFIPALMFGVTVLPTLLADRGAGTKHLVVVASDQQTAELIRTQLQERADTSDLKQQGRAPSPPSYKVEISTDASSSARAALTEKVKQKELDGIVWVDDQALAANKAVFVTRNVSSLTDSAKINLGVSRAVHRRVLKNKGLSDAEIEGALKPVDMETQSASGPGAPNPVTSFLTVFSMVMIMYMTVLLYGINVMRAILEEKTSRIMEVMLSTASAREMMAGKILGVGAVGLTQIAIWAVAAAVFGGVFGGGTLFSATTLKGVISLKLLVFFAVFFLLGYALYSTLCAAVGSMVNSEQEAQQMQFVVMMPMILSVIILVNIIQNPGTPLAFWGSMFPLTAPLIMFARMALETPPVWQIGLSIALMLATVYGLVWLCGRIYRVGILMYGKKPTLPEIIKWIKYA